LGRAARIAAVKRQDPLDFGRHDALDALLPRLEIDAFLVHGTPAQPEEGPHPLDPSLSGGHGLDARPEREEGH
jgi:hypothetical protein